MKNEDLIPIQPFCEYNQIEFSFMDSLKEYGLVEVTIVEGTGYLHRDTLPHIEKMARLHYDLNINIEGIESIIHLLERMDAMSAELNALRNRLRMHDSG